MNIWVIFMIVTEHLVWTNKCLLYINYSFHIEGHFILLCCTENHNGSNINFKEIVGFVKSLLTLWRVATVSGNVLGSWRIWETSASMKIFSFWNAEHLALTHRHFIAVREGMIKIHLNLGNIVQLLFLDYRKLQCKCREKSACCKMG